MSGPAHRRRSSGRTSWGRALLAFVAVAAFVLLALAALLLGAELVGDGPVRATEVTAAGAVLTDEPDQALPAVHALRQQTSTRSRTAAVAVLVVAVVVTAGAGARLRLHLTGSRRRARVVGRPPGRAPPSPRFV